MNYFRIIPDELIDWIEQRRNPERYSRLILILVREANWATGTYKDGVQLHKGQVRITLRKLAQRLDCSLDTVRRLVYSLEKAGWLQVTNENNVTIISLLWLTKPVHLSASNPFTSTHKPVHKPVHQPEQDTLSDSRCNPNQPEQQPVHQPERNSRETRSPFEAQPVIRSIRSIEVKEEEVKEEKNIGGDIINSSAEQKEDVGEEEERRGNLGKESKKVSSSLIALVTQNIINEFKLCYKRKFNRYPLIDTASIKRVQETLVNSASNSEELKDLANRLIQKIPAFFRLSDKWVKEKGYSFYAFSYRIVDLLSNGEELLRQERTELWNDWSEERKKKWGYAVKI